MLECIVLYVVLYFQQLLLSYMKKKSQRYSFKKLTITSKKPQLRLLDQYKNSYDKNVRSQSKHKSSQKIVSAYQTNSRFKMAKAQQRTRIKTQMDQFMRNKTPLQQRLGTKRDKGKLQDKSKFLQTRHLNLKRLNLQTQPDEHHSLEKMDTPHSGKHYSFRKAHESHRSGIKKTALEKYVSQSLENLQLANKKKVFSSSRHNDLKSTLKRQKNQQINLKGIAKAISSSKQKHQIKVQASPQKAQFRQSQKKMTQRQQRQQSLQKIQLKWQKKKKNPYDMSKQQCQIFGDRFPDGFDKIKLLGRGGFSLVWLGQHRKSKKKYAIKQIITQSSHQTHIKQIWFGTYFFEFGGAPKPQFADSPGIKHLVKLYYYFINKKDTWILYQKCGDSLGNVLYELKSQQFNGEKIYRIHYKDFYHRIRKNQNELRRIILDMAKALQLLAQNNIVHSDLKTQNILVRLKTQQSPSQQGQSHILQTKLIDYGSSFVFNNLRQFSMATPQYMAPQILNFILYQNQFQYIPKLLDYVQKYNNPWVIDVWSLGSVLLQIVSGIPLWMSLKTMVRNKKNSEVIKYGLFAIKGRAFDKIIKQQLEVVQNLDHFIYEQNYSGIVLEEDLRTLLRKMLALNPAKRISPRQIIQFLEKGQNKQ